MTTIILLMTIAFPNDCHIGDIIGGPISGSGAFGTGIEFKQVTIAADDTTPDVSGGNIFTTSANTGPIAITDLDNATAGQIVWICGGSNTNSSTIADASYFNLDNTYGAFTASLDSCIEIYVQADNDYIETNRTVMGGTATLTATSIQGPSSTKLSFPTDGTLQMTNAAGSLGLQFWQSGSNIVHIGNRDGTAPTYLILGPNSAGNMQMAWSSNTLSLNQGGGGAATFTAATIYAKTNGEMKAFGGTVTGPSLIEGRLSTTSVTLSTATKITLYTVPAGYTAVVTRIVVRNPSANIDTATFGFGGDANATDFLAAQDLTGLNDSTDAIWLVPPAGVVFETYAAAAVFGMKATVVEGAADTATVTVFGYLF